MPRFTRPRRSYMRGTLEFETSLTINDVDMDVTVMYSNQPAEPDVGIMSDSVEIEGVYFEDEGCLMGEMSDDQLDALAIEIGDHNRDAWEGAAEDYYERERED